MQKLSNTTIENGKIANSTIATGKLVTAKEVGESIWVQQLQCTQIQQMGVFSCTNRTRKHQNLKH